MTRGQRYKSQHRADVRARIDKFVRTPCTLTEMQTEKLLGELCGKLGWCLSPDDGEAVVTNPPTDPLTFAQLVIELDGGGVDDPDLFDPVLELVMRVFEGAAADTV